MGYLQDNLATRDNIAQVSTHWFILILPVSLFYVAPERGFIHWTRIILLALGLYPLLERLCLKIGSFYAITSKRVILKSGITKRDAMELMPNKCERIKIKQGIWGRIARFVTTIVMKGRCYRQLLFYIKCYQVKKYSKQNN